MPVVLAFRRGRWASAISAIYQARLSSLSEGRQPGEQRHSPRLGRLRRRRDGRAGIDGALTLAARERLEQRDLRHHCNLQRLERTRARNGQSSGVESLFAGQAGRHQSALGLGWDALFALDRHHALLKRFAATGRWDVPDARLARMEPTISSISCPGSELQAPRLASVGPRSSRRCGGAVTTFASFDAAFAAARPSRSPTVILAKTKKDLEWARRGESRNIAIRPRNSIRSPARLSAIALRCRLSGRRCRRAEVRQAAVKQRRNAYLRERRHALEARARRPPGGRPPYARVLCRLRRRGRGQGNVDDVAAVAHARHLLRDPVLGRIAPMWPMKPPSTAGRRPCLRSYAGGIYSPVGSIYEPEISLAPVRNLVAKPRRPNSSKKAITEPGLVFLDLPAGRRLSGYSVRGLLRDAKALTKMLSIRCSGFPGVGRPIGAGPPTSGREGVSPFGRDAHGSARAPAARTVSTGIGSKHTSPAPPFCRTRSRLLTVRSYLRALAVLQRTTECASICWIADRLALLLRLR